jgi:hypothetical protein
VILQGAVSSAGASPTAGCGVRVAAAAVWWASRGVDAEGARRCGLAGGAQSAALLLLLARRIDNSEQDNGSAVAKLVKVFQARLAALLEGKPAGPDLIDELRLRRHQRRRARRDAARRSVAALQDAGGTRALSPCATADMQFARRHIVTRPNRAVKYISHCHKYSTTVDFERCVGQ